MERVNSAQMQLGRWDFIEACMFMFAVADTVAMAATHVLRSSAVLRLLASCLVLYIVDFPRKISIFAHQRSLSALQSSCTGFPIFDERLQNETNEGTNEGNIN